MQELTIDREFARLGSKLSDEEYRLLEESIVDEGCRDPILVWANHDDIILDGHNRYEICRKHGVKFKTKAIHLLERSDCEAFMARIQLGRRNATELFKAMLRGKLYKESKRPEGRPEKNYDTSVVVSEAERIAENDGVSVRTMQREEKLHDAAMELSSPVYNDVMSGEVKASQKDVIALAELPKAEQRAIVAKVKSGEADSIKEAIADAEPAKAKAKVVKDREGSEVPTHLHAAAESKWRAEAVKLLNKLVEETKKNALPPGGMWTDVAEAIAGLHQARNILINSQFYCLCPSCGGAKKGCEDCRKSGWFPRWRLDEFNNQRGKK